MPEITRDQVKVPADVSADARETYIDNYMAATRGTGRLMLFACDQKIEHLNGDFYGEGIDPADLDPEHLFKIASEGVCGVCAGQRGLVARYAADYPEVNYLVKMNSKTNLVKTAQDDPYSPQLHDLEAVLDMRANGVNVVGLGYTIWRLREPRRRDRHHARRGRPAHRRGPRRRLACGSVDLPSRQGCCR